MTTETVFNEVQSKAESIACDKERAIEVMDIGDEVRQGDIYITMIDGKPAGAKQIKDAILQLAPGNTQGSRHCLRSFEGVKLFALDNPGPLDGPIIVADQPFTIDHPEHGNRTFPAGTFAITFQRAFADDLRRVQD